MQQDEWIAVDWGTSHLRAWIMQGNESVRALQSDQGMGRLAPQEFEAALLALLGDHLPPDRVVSVLCCGMVGAAQGWQDAGYQAVPCAPVDASQAVKVATRDSRLDLRILPGVQQDTPPDVMRGEETQIAGFLAAEPDFNGVVCLPGTHSKWVRITEGRITQFTSFMTGEVFALLSDHSVLRHSMPAPSESVRHWDDEVFLRAIRESMENPQALLGDLFAVRAGMLLAGQHPAACRSQLSGRLLGQELAGAQPYWQDQTVVLIGADELCRHYETALSTVSVDVRRVNGDHLVRAGLCAAFAAL